MQWPLRQLAVAPKKREVSKRASRDAVLSIPPNTASAHTVHAAHTPPTPPACSRQHKGPEFSLTGSQQSENNANAFGACLDKLLRKTAKHNISCATDVLPSTTGSGEKGEAVDWNHQKASRTMSKFIGHDNGLGKFIGHPLVTLLH